MADANKHPGVAPHLTGMGVGAWRKKTSCDLVFHMWVESEGVTLALNKREDSPGLSPTCPSGTRRTLAWPPSPAAGGEIWPAACVTAMAPGLMGAREEWD